MIADLKKPINQILKRGWKRREEKQFLQREYDSLHFYDHTSTCIPFVNFLFCSRLKIWGGCSLSKTTCVLYTLQS